MSRCKPLLRVGKREPPGRKWILENWVFNFRERAARSPTEAWEMGLAESVILFQAERRYCSVEGQAGRVAAPTPGTYALSGTARLGAPVNELFRTIDQKNL